VTTSRLLRSLPLLAALFAAALFAPASARPDRTFELPPTLQIEVKYLIRLLEEAHYNKEAVKPRDYQELIKNYMSDWDGQRMFFLESDRLAFETRFGEGLYWNIASLGRIDAAFDIFNVYETRANDRINWIFKELERDFKLDTADTFVVDRSEVSWPANAGEADDLWRRRLKFEIIQQLLSDKTVEEAKTTVRKRYERMLKNLADIEGLDLAESFLTNVAKLYDPHSTYFSADTFEDFSIQMRLQLVGIGALLWVEDDHCVVKEIITGGPADLDRRLKPNDKIIAVGQIGAEAGEPVDVIGMKLRKIVELIRGEKGTQVRLVVQPAESVDGSTREEIVITRDVVNLDSARAKAAIFEVPDREGNIRPIGVISLPTFYGPDSGAEGKEQNSATKDIAELIRRLNDAGVQGLVLDLRNNGGGLLSEAVELTGLFIPKGPVVQVRNYYGDVKVDSDHDASIAYTGPLAVLVSRFSASASEIVAGALQNYGRAVVIGDSSTHGKGTVQTVVEMGGLNQQLARERSGAAKLTIQKFYLPNGSSTQLNGVVPDIVLPSIEDLLPMVGEKDLPHALVWDEIPSSFFDGRPLASRVLTPLREASLSRQDTLEEFAYLKRHIDWFRTRQEQKEISLNLEERRRQKDHDEAFKDEMDAERERLAAANFAFKEFHLGKPPKPNKKAEPAENGDEPALEMTTDASEGYDKLDIHLREALRVVGDALDMARNPQFAAEQAPLTAKAENKS
jgi:carboxyl-terminal processing protease